MRESGRADFANLATKVTLPRFALKLQMFELQSPTLKLAFSVDRRNNTHDSRSDRRHRPAFDGVSIESGGASRFDASLLSSLNSPKIALQTLCRPVGQAVSNVSLGRATLALMDNNLLDDWFTKSQAAAVLQVSEKTVERMAHKGEIRRETRKRPGLRPLPVYSPEDLDRVKAAQVPQMAVLPPQAEAGGVPALAPRVDLPSFNRSYLVRDVPLPYQP